MTARLSWLHRCIIQWTARLVLATSGDRDIELIPQMPCWVASVQKTECCAIFGPPKIWVFVPRERVSNIPTVIFHGTLDGLCDDSRYADLIKLVDLSQ